VFTRCCTRVRKIFPLFVPFAPFARHPRAKPAARPYPVSTQFPTTQVVRSAYTLLYQGATDLSSAFVTFASLRPVSWTRSPITGPTWLYTSLIWSLLSRPLPPRSHFPPVYTAFVFANMDSEALATSPIPVPNADRVHQGWKINCDGVFYIRTLGLPWQDGPLRPLRFLSGAERIPKVEEVISPVVDHSLDGTFQGCKLDSPYSAHYYHAVFEVYVVPSQILIPRPGLQQAINSCEQSDSELFPPQYNQFPHGARRYLRCLVHPMPLPIPSPEFIPFAYSDSKAGWTVGKTFGEVFLKRLDPSEWTKSMKKATMDNDQGIAECVCVPHWEEHFIQNINHTTTSGSIGVLHDLDHIFANARYRDRFKPAGPTYPPGAVRFFSLYALTQDRHILLRFSGHPFRCPEDDDGTLSAPEEFYSENEWGGEEEGRSSSASDVDESPVLSTSRTSPPRSQRGGRPRERSPRSQIPPQRPSPAHHWRRRSRSPHRRSPVRRRGSPGLPPDPYRRSEVRGDEHRRNSRRPRWVSSRSPSPHEVSRRSSVPSGSGTFTRHRYAPAMPPYAPERRLPPPPAMEERRFHEARMPSAQASVSIPQHRPGTLPSRPPPLPPSTEPTAPPYGSERHHAPPPMEDVQFSGAQISLTHTLAPTPQNPPEPSPPRPLPLPSSYDPPPRLRAPPPDITRLVSVEQIMAQEGGTASLLRDAMIIRGMHNMYRNVLFVILTQSDVVTRCACSARSAALPHS
jgi:hypothetical protein